METPRAKPTEMPTVMLTVLINEQVKGIVCWVMLAGYCYHAFNTQNVYEHMFKARVDGDLQHTHYIHKVLAILTVCDVSKERTGVGQTSFRTR